MKYNYVIMATIFDWYQYMYQEIIGTENVKYYKDFGELLKPWERVLYKIHLSKRLNKIVHLPGKKIWYKKAIERIKFDNDRPVCFIWYSHFSKEIEHGMPEYIKEIMPEAKNIYYFTDQKNIKEETLNDLRRKMDLVGVFDPSAAKQYDLKFWPNVYPTVSKEDSIVEYDLCFIGRDKGRQKHLEEIADVCKTKGIRTAFYLMDPSGEECCDNIHYIHNLIPYEKCLELVKKSNCILELKMGKFDSCSVRVEEAVILGRKILTDNPNVSKMPCCAEGSNISEFTNTSDIDWEFVKNQSKVDYAYQGEYSASHFLKEIERELELT